MHFVAHVQKHTQTRLEMRRPHKHPDACHDSWEQAFTSLDVVSGGISFSPIHQDEDGTKELSSFLSSYGCDAL